MSEREGGAPAALFDVDGTLVDNSYFHAVAWWRACREHGELLPMARLHRLVGMGADQFTRALFGRERPELSEAHSRHIQPFFDEMVAFEGAPDLLRRVHELGVRVVLASSARADELSRLRAILGADDALDSVASSADAGASKPAPDIFVAALERSRADPGRSVAIGDTRWDVEAAQRSGMPCVAVMTGGWSRQELMEAGAVAVYSDVAELLAGLESSPIGRLAGAGEGAR
jgi:phosphoglycolate phosphatase-like HAD superfamily hydrolase